MQNLPCDLSHAWLAAICPLMQVEQGTIAQVSGCTGDITRLGTSVRLYELLELQMSKVTI